MIKSLKSLSPGYFIGYTLIFFFIFCLALVITPMIGSRELDILKIFNAEYSQDKFIILQSRLPRTLLSGLAGAVLAVSGMVFQAILRNDLATPFTLGVSSGASLGAVVAIGFGFEQLDLQLWGFSVVSAFSFLGALISVLLVFLLTKRSRVRISTYTLLLAGVAINFFFSSIILLIQYYSDFTQSFKIMRWLMGSCQIVGYEKIINIIFPVLAGLILLASQVRHLNLVSIGEIVAHSKGVNVQRNMQICFIAASLLTGAVISVTGPIGFVGLIIPHTVRFLVGADHRLIFTGSLFIGSAFLMVCDAMARTILSSAELPIGVITALLGGPFFMILLRRTKM